MARGQYERPLYEPIRSAKYSPVRPVFGPVRPPTTTPSPPSAATKTSSLSSARPHASPAIAVLCSTTVPGRVGDTLAALKSVLPTSASFLHVYPQSDTHRLFDLAYGPSLLLLTLDTFRDLARTVPSSRIATYVEKGGTLIFTLGRDEASAADSPFALFGLSWQLKPTRHVGRQQHIRLRPQNLVFPHEISLDAQVCISNIAADAAVYAMASSAENAGLASGALIVPVALANVGQGKIGFIGIDNFSSETDAGQVVRAMCQVALDARKAT